VLHQHSLAGLWVAITARALTASGVELGQARSGVVSLALLRVADEPTGKATQVQTSQGQLPPSLLRAGLESPVEAGTYRLRVAFEPSDWALHPPSRGRIRGAFTLQLAITPTQGSSGALDESRGRTCEDSTIEARQSDGPFHLFLPRASFLAAKKEASAAGAGGSLVKVVPLQTNKESLVRVTVSSEFASAALYTTLTPARRSGGAPALAQPPAAGKTWTCMPAFNSCQLDAVVPAGEYSLAFYHAGAAGCLRFALRIQMHATDLKYSLACQGARQQPADLTPQALVSTSTDESGRTSSRAALRWADARLMVAESDAGKLQVRDTLLVSLPAGSSTDSYVLHVRHRDARPDSRIDVAPFTSQPVATGGAGQEAADASSRGAVLLGSDGGWETVFSASHLSVDQESLFIYRGSQSGARAGAAVTLGLRVTSTLAFRHDACPTWGLSVNLQKLTKVRRAGQCPPGEGQKVPTSNLEVNPSGFGFEELDTFAPVSSWPPPDTSCHPEGGSGQAARECAHTADTSFTVGRASQLEVSLSFEGALASYTLVLIALNPASDDTTAIATGLPLLAAAGSSPGAGDAAASPYSRLSRVSLSHELPQGKYVVRVARKMALSSALPAAEASQLCSPLLWRIAVSPLAAAAADDDDSSSPQRPFVLDVSPPVRLFLSQYPFSRGALRSVVGRGRAADSPPSCCLGCLQFMVYGLGFGVWGKG